MTAMSYSIIDFKKNDINMKKTILLGVVLVAVVKIACGQMQTAAFGTDVDGVTVAGGAKGLNEATWMNPFSSPIYIWGIQTDIWLGTMIPPGESGDFNGADVLGEGHYPGWSYNHYLQNVCDVGVNVTYTDGSIILVHGSDHYDNSPTLNPGPIFFPKPFILPAGAGLHMKGHCQNGFQPWVGGKIIFNTDVIVYYTLSQ